MALKQNIFNEASPDEFSEDSRVVEGSHSLASDVDTGLKQKWPERHHITAFEMKLHLPFIHEQDMSRALDE